MDAQFLRPGEGFAPRSPSPSCCSVFSMESVDNLLDRLSEFPVVPSSRRTESGGVTVILEDALTSPMVDAQESEDGYFVPRMGMFNIDHMAPSGVSTIPSGAQNADISEMDAEYVFGSVRRSLPLLSLEPKSPGRASSISTASSDSHLATPQLTASPVSVITSVNSPITSSSTMYTHVAHAPSPRAAGSGMLREGPPARSLPECKYNERPLEHSHPSSTQSFPSVITTTSPALPMRGRSSSLVIAVHPNLSTDELSEQRVGALLAARALQPTPQPISPLSPVWPNPDTMPRIPVEDGASDFSWEARSTISGMRTPLTSGAPIDPLASPPSGHRSFLPASPPHPAVTAVGQVASTSTPSATSGNGVQGELGCVSAGVAAHDDDADRSTHFPEARSHCGTQAGSNQPQTSRSGPPSPSMSVFSSIEDDLLPDFLDLGSSNHMSFYGHHPVLSLTTVFEGTPDGTTRPSHTTRATSDLPRGRPIDLDFEDRGRDDCTDPVIPSFVPKGPRKSYSASELPPTRSAVLFANARPPLHTFASEVDLSSSRSRLPGSRRLLNINNNLAPSRDATIRSSTSPRPMLPLATQANTVDLPRRDSWRRLYDSTVEQLSSNDDFPSLGESDNIAAMLLDGVFSSRSRPRRGMPESVMPPQESSAALRDSCVLPDFQPSNRSPRARVDSYTTIASSVYPAGTSRHPSSGGSEDSRRDIEPAIPPELAASRITEHSMIPTLANAAVTVPRQTTRGRLSQHAIENHIPSHTSTHPRRGPPSVRSDASESTSSEMAELHPKLSGLLRPMPSLTLSLDDDSLIGHVSDSQPGTPYSQLSGSSLHKGRAEPYAYPTVASPTSTSVMSISLRPKKLKKAVSDELRSPSGKSRPVDELVSFMPGENKAKPAKRKFFGRGLGW
ncbi:hypothetical protein K488DRAFT_82649 [Vararia minispora EC-137]|uniref:Uncharacterized protein n=1 Tax=Vararia minispora EC-137 TaxID=1314806 RepID=A0ACB8QVF7_9AGAM|nr:hypothetical protein K488DRAFT_82649 [Vararia minispora EC-137]